MQDLPIFRNRPGRPDIRLNPVPAGYPTSISGPGSGPVSENLAGYLAGNFFYILTFIAPYRMSMWATVF